jgi:hypothetical protein
MVKLYKMDKQNAKKGKRISQKMKKEKFIEIFELSACNVSLSCKKAKIARQTFYNWIEEDSDFAEKIAEAQEGILDMAESMLLKKVREGSTSELIFLLKTKGKSRGYVERQEWAGVEEQPIVWKETKTYREETTSKGAKNMIDLLKKGEGGK